MAVVAVLGGFWLGLRTHVPDLETADRVTLISIDFRDQKPDAPPAGEEVHGYPVLGRVEITDPGQRRRLGDALRQGLREPKGPMVACFWPRHVLRVEHGPSARDYVICFHCRNYHLYMNGEPRGGGHIGQSVRPAFDEPLMHSQAESCVRGSRCSQP